MLLFSDGINDNGDSLLNRIKATVRWCDPDKNCPWTGAKWNEWNNRMYFGEGYVADDVVAHEYTHGVTEHESNLIYENHSGAINESFPTSGGNSSI